EAENFILYTGVVLGVTKWNFFVETEINTYMVKDQSFMFQPYTQEYLIRAGYNFKYIKLEYEHLCGHSIDMYGEKYGHDKVTISFDTRGFK
ncbi:unnamed protein product, partial [marine sediment metagenome]